MLKKSLLIFYCSITLSSLSCKDSVLQLPLTIHLQDPHYQDGILESDQGGVIKGEGFRLQANKLTYTKKTQGADPCHKVTAKGNLMLDYHGQIVLGDYLEYNFLTNTGYILNGKTSSGVWFIYGKKIILHPDHSCEVFEARITTSDNEKIVLEMSAERIHLTKNRYLSTKNIRFKVLNTPILWVPGFNADLKYNPDSPIHYGVTWDSGQGPKITMRYRVYSWNNFNVYLRGDYHYKRGPGGALELDYLSDDKITLFQSRNYLAKDTFYNDDHPNKKKKRFRIQGLYQTRSKDNKGHITLTYDRISDKNMPGDFKSSDFELNTAKETKLISRYYHDKYIAGFNVQPRINSFQGFNQELPAFNLYAKPLKLGPTPFILENRFHLAYLDYVYSNDIKGAPSNIEKVLADFHSVRAETHQKLYLPLHFKNIDFTPGAGFIGIAYNNNPFNESALQSVFTYDATLTTSLTKRFTRYKHTLSPYVYYQGLNTPLQNSNNVYIFDIHDGYHRMNLLKVGINNLWYNLQDSPFIATARLDAYALGFLADQTFRIPFPKAGFFFEWTQQNLKCTSDVRWNFNNHVLDFANLALHYTFNANFACYLEYRHRSRYDWRKDQHDNFILDVTRPIPILLDSPLSDGRNTLLSRAEIKLSPKWTCQLETHCGWGRSQQPGYTEAKVDLITLLSSAWKLKISYTHTTRGKNHLGMSLNLIQ